MSKNPMYRIIVKNSAKAEMTVSSGSLVKTIKQFDFLVACAEEGLFDARSIFARRIADPDEEKPGRKGIAYWVDGAPDRGYKVKRVRDAVK